MKDETFIEELLLKGKEAKNKVEAELSEISVQQLNWKPSPETWSIAQCLEHLIISDSCYFTVLEKITAGNYQMSFWEKHRPFTKMFGRFFRDQLREQVKKKMTAPKKIQPPIFEKNFDLIEDYYKN